MAHNKMSSEVTFQSSSLSAIALVLSRSLGLLFLVLHPCTWESGYLDLPPMSLFEPMFRSEWKLGALLGSQLLCPEMKTPSSESGSRQSHCWLPSLQLRACLP